MARREPPYRAKKAAARAARMPKEPVPTTEAAAVGTLVGTRVDVGPTVPTLVAVDVVAGRVASVVELEGMVGRAVMVVLRKTDDVEAGDDVTMMGVEMADVVAVDVTMMGVETADVVAVDVTARVELATGVVEDNVTGLVPVVVVEVRLPSPTMKKGLEYWKMFSLAWTVMFRP